MVYPVFEESIINDRCNEDIMQFIGEYKISDNLGAVLQIDNLNTKNDLVKCIDILITKMRTIMEAKSIKYKMFDYSHDIHKFEPLQQQNLWILRTYLFYQLLIFATKIMKSKSLFDEIYGASIYKRDWNKDITAIELRNFKMGIFGSLTPTSDIDIGIAYIGLNEKLTALAYVVSVVEDMFKIFMGKSSLQLDIEPYADMYVLPNPKQTSEEDSLIFYLDTTKFTKSDYMSMLPYVGASILRNYVTAQNDLTEQPVKNIIDGYNWENAFAYFDSIGNEGSSSSFSQIYNNFRFEQIDEENWHTSAKMMIVDYMTKDYDGAREEYYKLVKSAEESIMPIKHIIFENPNSDIPNTMIVTAMQKIAHALVFRAESYTCAPTIMHVVRVLQANKNDPNKYKTITPQWCDEHKTESNKIAICKIGRFGYLISMFEQLGYMYRFHLTYCDNTNNHYDAEKCKKKISKYQERLNDAIGRYNTLPVETNINRRNAIRIMGGSRATKKRRQKQTRRRGKRYTRKTK